MPIIRSSNTSNYDEEDRKRFHYKSSASASADSDSQLSPTLLKSTSNQGSSGSALAKTAAGKAAIASANHAAPPTAAPSAANGAELLGKAAGMDEQDYTRLELDDDPEEDDVHMRTDFLFDDEKEMTPLSQMQATKTLLSEGQRIAYVGLCKLVTRDLVQKIRLGQHKELEAAAVSAQNWAHKIMGRLYLHMDVNSSGKDPYGFVTVDPSEPICRTTHDRSVGRAWRDVHGSCAVSNNNSRRAKSGIRSGGSSKTRRGRRARSYTTSES